MDKVDRYIERVQHLPAAPPVVAQLHGLFADPNRDTERLAELISYDPSLTAEVLKRCNSAFFRGAEPPGNIFEAVSGLGFQEVQYVVSAVTGAHGVSRGRIEDALDVDRLWRHCQMTAVAAAALARQAEDQEAAPFTAGLLHDIGKLVFASLEGPVYKNLLQQAGYSGSALARAEEVALGTTHAELGARLLTRWGLPTNITLAVLHHHGSPAAATPYERLAATLHLANRIAHNLAGDEVTAPELPSSDTEALSLLELTTQAVPAVLEQTQEQFRKIQEGLKAPEEKPRTS
jgi:putative nucleotidyltransferase with HDIG domain